MTLIRFKMGRPSSSGVDVPASGGFRVVPTKLRVVEGDPDTVILPAEFPVTVPESGLLDLELAPTGPGWCWRLSASGFGVSSWQEYVAVPEPVADPDRPGEYLPVDYPDLVRVDPATLEPSAEPDPAWWAFAESMAVSGTEAVAAAASAGVARDESVAARDAAGLSASGAAGSADAAAVSAGEAQAGATVASAQAGEASASRALAEAARDSTVAAAGGSELSAAQASSAAIASAQSAADAEAAALDVVTRANNGEFKGDQGLPGNATMRVDTTVGTRVFITDGATEHMIKGDTGWRAIQWWGTDGVVGGLPLSGGSSYGYVPATGRAGGVYYRRINDTVHVRVLAITTTDSAPSFPIPAGFNAGGSPWPSGLIRGNDATPYQYRAGGSAIFSGLASGLTTEAQYAIEFSWVTKSPWPTTNHGIPG